ncbi:hypothetical protein CsSME_00032452 [Camellia sinensis var. sinensis]
MSGSLYNKGKPGIAIEQIEDDEAGGGGNENGENQLEDLRSKASRKDQLIEMKKKTTVSIDEDDKEECAELLALPPHGSEIFVGGLPRDINLMKNRDTGEGKSFAFVTFKTKEVTQQAIEELHNKEFKGKTLRCSLSETKHKLFIVNVLKTWIDDEFRKVIEVTGPEAKNIELIKNRGFAFGEYYNNVCADYSRQKMSNTNKNHASIRLAVRHRK